MGIFDWLFGKSGNKIEKELVEIKDAVIARVEERIDDVVDDVIAKAKVIADTTEKVAGGYVDDETGKVYKTAGALKGVQTRRRNKKAKAKAAKKAKK